MNFSPESPQPKSVITSPQKRTVVDIKADLYSIFQTAAFLKDRFESGMVDALFYYRRLKHSHSELVGLQNELSLWNRSLLEIIDDFKIDQNFTSILSVISSIQDFKFNEIAQTWQLDPYLLASVATECTSNFITIIDYLHLIEAFEEEFFQQLMGDLEKSLSQINTFQPFLIQIAQLNQNLPHYLQQSGLYQATDPTHIKSILQKIEQSIYTLFQEFKQYLHIQ
ncbi:hypothetical protein [Candidatus Lokiarchaeum ossiferum]|uniref:hypothetical protein n=1 Tax=Candidatus Lokiarchaeum ossiferum TaxID=2951803 RepID=UPI00352C787B